MKKGRYFPSLMVALAIATPAVSDNVYISTRYGKYFTAVGGGGGAVNASSRLVSQGPTNSEKFLLMDSECLMYGDSISLRTLNGKYVGIVAATGDLQAVATSSSAATEKFTIESPGASGLAPRPVTVSLKASNGKYVCGGDAGVLKANCATAVDGAYFTLEVTGGVWGAFAVTPVVNMGSPARSGADLTLTANTSGGAHGTSKYKYVVRDVAGTQVATSATNNAEYTGNYAFTWRPVQAGNYTVSATVQRYCQGSGPLFTATGTLNEKIVLATIARPDDGAVDRGQALSLSWTVSGGLTGGGVLDYFDEAMYTTTKIRDLNDVTVGSASWTVPANLAVTSKGRIRLTSFANANLSWDSDAFSVGTGVVAPPAVWGFTQTLTQQHFTEAGVTADYSGRLAGGAYSISSILNSATDRLVDNVSCNACHDGTNNQSAGKYQPAFPVAKNTEHKRTKGGSLTTGYRWNNTSNASPAVVYHFIATTLTPGGTKPADLEKLFQTWIDKGAP